MKRLPLMLRYPRKYEEATEIVDLLLSNENILIDFQYSEAGSTSVVVLDYLDGARYIWGNLRRVASTMYFVDSN